MSKKSLFKKNPKLPLILSAIVVALALLIYCGVGFWRYSRVKPIPEFVLNDILRQISPLTSQNSSAQNSTSFQNPASNLLPEPLTDLPVSWISSKSQQNYMGRGLRWSAPVSQINPIRTQILSYFKSKKFKANELNISAGSLENSSAYQYKNLACTLKESLSSSNESLGVDDLRQQTDAPATLDLVCFNLK